ncbi:MAG: hypothetical protein E6471_01315 [Bradyrhizobium sp.]|nr:hypothetical protein [Bradyrhizobium sp.]
MATTGQRLHLDHRTCGIGEARLESQAHAPAAGAVVDGRWRHVENVGAEGQYDPRIGLVEDRGVVVRLPGIAADADDVLATAADQRARRELHRTAPTKLPDEIAEVPLRHRRVGTHVCRGRLDRIAVGVLIARIAVKDEMFCQIGITCDRVDYDATSSLRICG